MMNDRTMHMYNGVIKFVHSLEVGRKNDLLIQLIFSLLTEEGYDIDNSGDNGDEITICLLQQMFEAGYKDL